jgi:hypothetical protein
MIAWYIVPYKYDTSTGSPGGGLKSCRYCAMDDYTTEIRAAGGRWTETEILGNRAIVKLRAPSNIIAQADGTFKRIPKNRLDDSLADLPSGVKTALKNEILDQGYTIEEVHARFGDDLGNYTLRQVLQFMATRKKKARYDSQADEIVLDGPNISCRTIESVDAEVQE